MKNSEKLYLVDVSGYVYRAFHALPSMQGKAGQPTQALFGFARSLMRLIKDYAPEHIVAVFDGPHNKRRRQEYFSEYKANRKATPDELLSQLPLAQDFCDLVGIKKLVLEGEEADDVMASLAKWGKNQGAEVVLCTMDKDLLQLVDERTKVLQTFKDNTWIDKQAVIDKYGIGPEQFRDWLAIVGDSSDNVPGVPGIGPKGATSLLQEFGNLENLLDHASQVKGKKGQTLQETQEQARLSYRLVGLYDELAFPKDWKLFEKQSCNSQALREFLVEMNFKSLLKELDEATPPQAAPASSQEPDLFSSQEGQLSLFSGSKHQLAKASWLEKSEHKAFIAKLEKAQETAVVALFDDSEPFGELVALGFEVNLGKQDFILIDAQTIDETFLKELLGYSQSWVCLNSKALYLLFIEGMPLVKEDLLLASYLCRAKGFSEEGLLEEACGRFIDSKAQAFGKKVNYSELSQEQKERFLVERLEGMSEAKKYWLAELEEKQMLELYRETELPLALVIAKMEKQGIYLDKKALGALSQELGGKLTKLEKQAQELAGETFNLNSPKQLGEILFEKLGLTPLKKTQSGYATGVEILEQIKDQHPIIEVIMEYRLLEKLRSTYVDALPQLVAEDGRLHPHFRQAFVATGRLSCQHPNLQNIPVRSEYGKKIREAFVPEPSSWQFLSADYSQIELRILAHLSEDPVLIAAFLEGQDIHQKTAAEVFSVPLEEVSSEQRSAAKAVNFGILYGQQAFGLAGSLGIDQKKAADFIKLYFKRFPKVAQYLEASKALAKEKGYSETLYKRRRPIADLNSSRYNLKQAAERLALNSPIQGTGADLMKFAMLRVDELLRPYQARVLLQVHDELIIELPESELEELQDKIRKTMESVAELKVPLLVNVSVGKNWREC